MPDARRALRAIPSVDRLLAHPAAQPLLGVYQRARVVDVLRAVLDEWRQRLAGGEPLPEAADLIDAAARRLAARGPVLQRVVNATGVGLHTNLGRAPLAAAAVDALVEAARGPVALELDLATGRRGDRDALLRDDLRALTGAEDALVVNNNAAAVVLALAALARGREVIVSRGELVEIGGSFRMPEVMAASGARLHEVGTTNRTHAADYERAIGPDTALLMKVHTSNFRVVGFTASVALAELVAIGRAAAIPVLDDLGSGALLDPVAHGLPAEPVVSQRVAAGADLVTFSGDKLLGGPQAGIVVGRRDLVARLARHPLRRALRPDKLTIAALGATLRLYREAPDPLAVVPIWRWLTRPLDELEAVGRASLERLATALGAGYRVELVASEAEVGSGAAPARPIPSRALAVTHATLGPDAIAARFRAATPPVLGRIFDGRFLLDLRGVERPEDLLPDPAACR
ncbi:MAG TPA: L-seryl-tRNA(Sec) selenium transferase [Candidatus Limnocylindria bacterium]|nr:L-seryl-tRNA(Sec) selenium transferase [Candidatus Limnocylindria bacterium]